MDTRAEIDVETLLKVILVLAVVWLALVVVDLVTDLLLGLVGILMPIVGLAIIALIALWLLDRI